MAKSLSSLKGGRTLEQALRAFSDPALLAELAKEEALIAPLIDTFGCDAVVQGFNTSHTRKALETEFLKKLTSGELLATGHLAQTHWMPSPFAERKLISPQEWMVLTPNFNDSSAKDWDKRTIYEILVYRRSTLLREADPSVEAAKGPDASPKPLIAVASRGFRKVSMGGRTLAFGPNQARALAELHHASSAGQPWLTRDDLLERAGSQLQYVKDLFRDKDWQLLIEEGRLENGRHDQFRLRPDIEFAIPDQQAD